MGFKERTNFNLGSCITEKVIGRCFRFSSTDLMVMPLNPVGNHQSREVTRAYYFQEYWNFRYPDIAIVEVIILSIQI